MTVTLGNLTLPLEILAGITALILTFLFIQISGKDKDFKKETGNRIFNLFFIGLITWKITPLFTDFERIKEYPQGLIFTPGGVTGSILALGVMLLYTLWVWKKRSTHRTQMFFFAFFLLGTTLLTITGSIISRENRTVTESMSLNVTDSRGNELTIIPEEKPIILNFWATWCPPCRAEMPELAEFYRNYSDETEFYAVNLIRTEKSPHAGEEYVISENLPFPVYYDSTGALSAYFNIKTIPTTVVLKKTSDGINIQTHGGVITEAMLKKMALD